MGRNRSDYPERCEVELDYGREASVGRDLKLLLRNLLVVLKGR